MREGAYSFQIATAEKALCDQVYKTSPVANYEELQVLLFEDLRIEKQEIKKLNVADTDLLAEKYHNTNIKKLSGMIRRL